MSEWRLFDEGTVPEWSTPEWYAGREAAPHLEQEGHRQRLLLTAELTAAHVRTGDFVVDVGSGDGGLLSHLRDQYGILGHGYDLQQTNVDAAAARGVNVQLRDVVVDGVHPDDSRAAAFIASEVLEHLVDPRAFCRMLHAAGVPFLIASSPYTETDESHYDFHLWAWDFDGYRQMLADAGWEVIVTASAWISQIVVALRA